MITTSICACAAFIFLCVAIATDYWLNMIELRKAENSANVTRHYTYAGLWRRCNYTEGTYAEITTRFLLAVDAQLMWYHSITFAH